MKNVKVEWCENFIRAAFTKHFPPEIKNPGIEVDCFWRLAEASGLWVRGTYGSPMSLALNNLCDVADVHNDEGTYLFSAFVLKTDTEKQRRKTYVNGTED